MLLDMLNLLDKPVLHSRNQLFLKQLIADQYTESPVTYLFLLTAASASGLKVAIALFISPPLR
jgi:hypothetical protein